MKFKLPLLVGLTSLAALIGAQAQSAVTDPVGYVTVSLAGGTPAVPSVSIVGPVLTQKIEFSGVVSGKPGANQLSFAASSFAAGAFSANNALPAAAKFKFWVELSNGSAGTIGMWTDIESNTTNTITTNDDLNAMVTAGSTTVKIRAHQTISTFFGATNSAGLVAGAEAAVADNVVLIDPVTQNQTVIFFSNDPDAPGWLDAAAADHANDVIAPGQGLIVRHRGAAAGFVQTGYVKTGPTVVSVMAGNNLITPTLATGVTFAKSGMAAGITQGTEAANADTVLFYSAGSPNVVFLSNDPDAPGWQDAAATLFNDTLLPESTAILLKNSVNPAEFDITFPAQAIAN